MLEDFLSSAIFRSKLLWVEVWDRFWGVIEFEKGAFEKFEFMACAWGPGFEGRVFRPMLIAKSARGKEDGWKLPLRTLASSSSEALYLWFSWKISFGLWANAYTDPAILGLVSDSYLLAWLLCAMFAGVLKLLSREWLLSLLRDCSSLERNRAFK